MPWPQNQRLCLPCVRLHPQNPSSEEVYTLDLWDKVGLVDMGVLGWPFGTQGEGGPLLSQAYTVLCL